MLLIYILSRPANREELFNLRHAQARNIIERIFGVIKNTWMILQVPSHFDMDLQATIPPALCALHNFIARNDPFHSTDGLEDDHTPGIHVEPLDIPTSSETLGSGQISDEERDRAGQWRDKIAQTMWDQYLQTQLERGV